MTNKKSKLRLYLLVLVGALAATAVFLQLYFNLYIWRVAQDQSTLRIAILIKSAIDNVDELKSQVGDDYRIEEAKLQLPGYDQEVGELSYFVYENDKGEFDNVQITSRNISQPPRTKLLGQTNMDDLFELVPKAQACSRGLTLRFDAIPESDGGLKLVGSQRLNDGRTLNVYRELDCNAEFGVDELQNYIFKAQSY